MTEPSERGVCDLSLIMRTRLLLGQYNKYSVAPRWRRAAQLYCFTIIILNGLYISRLLRILNDPLYTLYYAPMGAQILIAKISSLFTGEEYVCIYFRRNKLTDITLDSPAIFNRLQKQMNQVYIFSVVYFSVFVFLSAWAFYMNVYWLISFVVPLAMYEMVAACSFSTKLLVMALFNARMLILKRRLQRYGFRTFGRAQPQPYCQIFDEIWETIDSTDSSLKIMLFLDVMVSCSRFICMILMGISESLTWQSWKYSTNNTMFIMVYLAVWVGQWLMFSFGHVVLLESAAAHCEDMAVFTTTQLIKNPTKEERLRMRDFLRTLERRGAQYRVIRALPLDARFVLRALDFCTAQVFVFVNTIFDI